MPTSPFAAEQSDYIARLNELANASFSMAAIQVADFTAVRGWIYPLGANGLNVTFPIAAASGDRIRFYATTDSISGVQLLPNGLKIETSASTFAVVGTGPALAIEAIYVDATKGWRLIRINATQGFSVQTANFTAVKSNVYGVDTNGLSITLPATPNAGDWVTFVATQAAVVSATFLRNGSNIGGAAADYAFSAGNWEVTFTWLNSTQGWVSTWEVTGAPGAHWNSTVSELRYSNTQRELAASLGWLPYALPMGIAGTESMSITTTSLPTSGGSIAIAFMLTSHMLLDGFTFVNNDTTGAHTLEWRVYKQALNNGNSGEGTLSEVAGANGTFTFTPGAAGLQTSAAAGAPVYLAPGLYWVVLRNTSASVAAVLRCAPAGTLTLKSYQTKTLGSALASTLDFVTSWSISGGSPAQVGARLNGRVFGQTAATFV